MIPCFDAIRAINKERGDTLVISTCTPTQYWGAISRRKDLDLPLPGTMGKASSLALGVAMARPQQKVMVLDGDGSILMNLGSLVTIAGVTPSNLVHFVFQDGEYFTTGRQPIPGAEMVDLAGLAREAGFQKSYEFDDLEDFVGQLKGVLQQPGPVLVCLKVDHPEPVPPFVRGPKLAPGKW
jgi:thiamine pyrophosphate-dependent acetolactate synthase large subunit-like protein